MCVCVWVQLTKGFGRCFDARWSEPFYKVVYYNGYEWETCERILAWTTFEKYEVEENDCTRNDDVLHKATR